MSEIFAASQSLADRLLVRLAPHLADEDLAKASAHLADLYSGHPADHPFEPREVLEGLRRCGVELDVSLSF